MSTGAKTPFMIRKEEELKIFSVLTKVITSLDKGAGGTQHSDHVYLTVLTQCT